LADFVIMLGNKVIVPYSIQQSRYSKNTPVAGIKKIMIKCEK